MNVELVNPALVLRLFSPSDRGQGQLDSERTPPPAKGVWARLDGAIRHRRALQEHCRLDDRELDDLDLIRADLPALAWRHANGLEPLARS